MPPQNGDAEAAFRGGGEQGDAQSAYERGNQLVRRRDFDAAHNAYEDADQRGHGGAAAARGIFLESSGDTAGAEAAYLRYELEWARRINAPAQARAYKQAAAVVVNYDSVRRLLADAHGPRVDVRVLPYAAATAFETPTVTSSAPLDPICLNDGDGPPLIVSVSNHSPRKGLDVLIRALARLRDHDIPFRACLLGTGILLEDHRRLTRSLGLERQVAIPGRVPDVLAYVARCDVYVLPSTEEGSGSVAVLEALQAGAPIVASRLDGIPEDLTHERDALLVTPAKADALADALARLLGDAALRGRLATAGRELYAARFSAARAAAALSVLYGSVGLSASAETACSQERTGSPGWGTIRM